MAKAESENSTEFKSTAEEVSHGLSDLETLTLSLRNMAYAIRMLASSDEMPKEPGAALDSIADRLVNDLDYLITERERLWHLSEEVLHPPGSIKVGAV
jgi:hypothetical protein